jgi:hypothetical protein
MQCSRFPDTAICRRKSGARLSYLVLTILVTALSHKTENVPLSLLVISYNSKPPPPCFPMRRDLRAFAPSMVYFTFLSITLRMPSLN